MSTLIIMLTITLVLAIVVIGFIVCSGVGVSYPGFAGKTIKNIQIGLVDGKTIQEMKDAIAQDKAAKTAKPKA